ncbi:hypothetical protein F7984_01735 [Pradoshia sp. D12]|uniref:hypothetical protein n=1 Tax=Bacillaceae TaxID=186817 RepID=UPI00080AC8E2|nr:MULTISPECIES: hypothetical protein [Bacillaceae]OCA80717.1 hypothetical protein A8L44_16240 [Bacillus sp. FJAT-27986]QFK70073.1 hypothetical protein F7984_01735 [Pradoshia sp. D12]TPF70633.1 hypothetical protein FHY44_16870 [Bacillus sp. D12]
MSKKEKRWSKFYKYFMIFFYVLLVPIAIFDFFAGGGFPYEILIVGLALPAMRTNHLNIIRAKGG